MRTLIIALIAGLSFNVFADKNSCLEKLTYNFSVDSRAFKLDTDSINITAHENDHLAISIEMIRALLNFSGCDGRTDINFGWGPLGRTSSSCKALVGKRENSQVCYIETDLGYFFVTNDLQTTAHIIFSRWD